MLVTHGGVAASEPPSPELFELDDEVELDVELVEPVVAVLPEAETVTVDVAVPLPVTVTVATPLPPAVVVVTVSVVVTVVVVSSLPQPAAIEPTATRVAPLSIAILDKAFRRKLRMIPNSPSVVGVSPDSPWSF
jgi:hypothetical protein